MLKFKKIFTILIASVFLFAISACSSPKETPASQTSKQTLNIGAISSIDVIPIIMAAEKGYFEKEEVAVNFQPFKSAKDRDAAFQSGNLDGIICDVVAVSLYQNADFDVKITGITDGDFMLIANPNSGIKAINDLIGKSIAISEKTCIEYTLDKILKKNALEPNDVQKSMVPPIPTRLEMLRTNNVDTALLPEPFSTLAIQDGGILLGSANQEGFYPSVTAFTQQAINTKPNEIKAFYKAYNEAVDYINNTPIAEYEDIIIKTVGYPEDMKGKITLPVFRKNMLPSEEDIQSVINWAVENGLVQKTLNPKNLLNDIGIQ
ncbi:ABC transporter substrate-binding protein [Geosporobacter ferrireducens]|uniref:Metal ABC transporter substrate-binding protein n=1 Tax=Geosporobacter ferrireducens TaxID=1424294 RepID=A0A1D8GFD9_9FIRM|nr:MetQ/NlpA family ABC transporter substrate-binding protein [Geosporobacter ferrireducens]AOT69626.1 metal ABC transporter substrate-binding protein [Geosporobacter ferrireducens]MTI54672.1 metal ABC transporter substrate-binding protein [Geosporobacter ferrireducens]